MKSVRNKTNIFKVNVSLENNEVVKNVPKGHVVEFYHKGKNVTPVELHSSRFPNVIDNKNQSSPPVNTNIEKQKKEPRIRIEENIDTLLNLNLVSTKNLLDEIFGIKVGLKESKYDVGPDMLYLGKRDYVTEGYEVELTESDSFVIMEVPSSITVKGDGDYENVQKRKDVYINNRLKPIAINDNISQTINCYVEDKECQTSIPSINTAGTQVHFYNIIDEYSEIDKEQQSVREPLSTNNQQFQEIKDLDAFFDKTMILERLLSHNTLVAEQHGSMSDFIKQNTNDYFTYFYTLVNKYKGLIVSDMHWNKIEINVLAVAYSKMIYGDVENKPTVVAVWNVKNVHNPERLYEFEDAITCIKFSPENKNHLAIGFKGGKLLIIDICSRNLKIVFDDTLIFDIFDLFWTSKDLNAICLITYGNSDSIYYYFWSQKKTDSKTLMNLPQTAIIQRGIKLNSDTGAFATSSGKVYVCSFDSKEISSEILAHRGPVKSLEKSPFSEDIFLTIGFDCCIKIWIRDILIEPAIVINTEDQIIKAMWSPISSTVIVSISENCICIWDINESKHEPLSILEMHSGNKCFGMEVDARHLCVSDINGNISVYTWLDTSANDEPTLLYCVALSLYSDENLIKILCEKRPNFCDIVSKITTFFN